MIFTRTEKLITLIKSTSLKQTNKKAPQNCLAVDLSYDYVIHIIYKLQHERYCHHAHVCLEGCLSVSVSLLVMFVVQCVHWGKSNGESTL